MEKAKEVFGSVWSATVSGVDSGLEFTRDKSKKLGEKWDNSETG